MNRGVDISRWTQATFIDLCNAVATLVAPDWWSHCQEAVPTQKWVTGYWQGIIRWILCGVNAKKNCFHCTYCASIARNVFFISNACKRSFFSNIWGAVFYCAIRLFFCVHLFKDCGNPASVTDVLFVWQMIFLFCGRQSDWAKWSDRPRVHLRFLL